MSRIYFDSKHDSSEVFGADRAAMGCSIDDIALPCLNVSNYDFDKDPIIKFLPPDCYLVEMLARPRGDKNHLRNAFMTYLKVHNDAGLIVDGEHYDMWTLILNTAIKIGGPELQFITHMHAQCEIFGWVAEEDRPWAADMIDSCLDKGIVLRHGMGWDKVTALLRNGDGGPVVTHYSVSDSFPSASLAKRAGVWHPGPEHEGHYTAEQEAEYRKYHADRESRSSDIMKWPYNGPFEGEYWWDGDEFDELADEQQWDLCVSVLEQYAPQWTPESIGNTFGHNKDFFWIRQKANELEQSEK